jgi:hypothetical protein
MAGNRTLHFDQYCMLVLLFLFNPVVRSLRAIEQASELRKVQRKLGCRRASLASLSEATDVFQPELLKEIIAELAGQLQPIARDPRLKDVQHTLTLVDGTLLKGLPVLLQAAMSDPRAAKHKAKFRLHTQFDLERGGSAGPASNGQLLIATNLLDLPAWIIALIYRYRWTIEIQTYCAIIACMLISLWTGRKPTLRTYEMICHYFTGLAEEDELLAHLAKLQKQDAST